MGPESYSAPSTPPLPRWALDPGTSQQTSLPPDSRSLTGRAFIVSKKPLKPISKRPATRHRRFTKPTPVRRILAPAPQPCGCAPLAARTDSFEVPGLAQRKNALGGSSGTPFLIQKVLRFAEAWFEPIPEPRLDDWLGKHRELMQSFDAFRSAWEEQRDFIGPNDLRRVVHLMALGPEEPAPKVMQVLQEACAAFFSPLRVAVIRSRTERKESRVTPPLPAEREEEPERSVLPPLVTEDILPWLAAGLRSDSVVTVAVTLSPLTSSGKCTVGASDWSKRVGVFSLESVLEEPLSSRVMERTTKFLTHQVTHMLGVLHCCYFRCLMNGAAHQEEADGRPPYLCGVCLKKLHLVTGLDPLLRYQHLARFWAWAGSPQIAMWYETRVRVVRSTFANAQVQLPPTCRLRPPKEQKDGPGGEEGARTWRSQRTEAFREESPMISAKHLTWSPSSCFSASPRKTL